MAVSDPPESAAVTIVLPVLDEEGGLGVTLDALRGALAGTGRTWEIVVVDDGSTDGTAAVLRGYHDVKVVRHAETRGYGASLKAGIRAASHPLVVVMDADGTYPPSAIPALVEGCATADMVVGARVGEHVHATPLRSAMKWCFRQFAQWITFARIPDLNSGLRVFRRGVAERFMDVLPDGFSFTTTITVASILEGFTVRFEAVDYLPRIGKSKLRPVPDTFRIARQLLRLGLRFSPLRTGVALAIPFAAAFAGLAARHLLEIGRVTAGDLAFLAAALGLLGAGVAAEQRVRRRRGEGPGLMPSRNS